MDVNQQNCAPCMLMNIDGRIDHSLRVPGEDEQCAVCDSAEDEAIMIMCDGCGKGYHTYCLQPPLDAVPDSIIWVCPKCEAQGVQLQPLLEQRVAADAAELRPNQALMFPNAAQRTADQQAAQYDGQVIKFRKGARWLDGVLRFVHRQDRPAAWARRPLRVEGMRGDAQWHTLKQAEKLIAASNAQGLVATVAVLDLRSKWFVAAAAEQMELPRKAAAKQLLPDPKLDTVEGCRSMGELLLPGGLEQSEAEALHRAFMWSSPVRAKAVFTSALLGGSMPMLLGAVDLRSCARLCCPCAGFGSAEAVVEACKSRYGKHVMANVVSNDYVLMPAFYRHLSRQSPIDWVFLFVPAGLEEVCLAVAAAAVSGGVALLCGADFMTSGPVYRQRLLQQYMDEGRLAVISQHGRKAVWVCVFATSGHLNIMCNLPRNGAFCEKLPKAVAGG
jgi:PHD-finger